MFVWDNEVPSGLLNAASWRLGAELVAALPNAYLMENREDGGGQYDILSVHVGWRGRESVHLAINRNGSVHFHTSPTPAPSMGGGSRFWLRACRPGGTEALARDILTAGGLQSPNRNRSPKRLTYQVIAHVLTARALDTSAWDARLVLAWDEGEHEPVPDASLRAAPEGELWRLTAGGSAVAWFWGGWCVLPGGTRLDLTRERAAGASLADLAALVTRRLPPGNASALPAGDGLGTIPARKASRTDWLVWAGRYDGYALLAGGSHQLEELYAPIRREYVGSGVVPAWCGRHLLRGWLFLLYRMDYASGGGSLFTSGQPETDEWDAVVARLRHVEAG